MGGPGRRIRADVLGSDEGVLTPSMSPSTGLSGSIGAASAAAEGRRAQRAARGLRKEHVVTIVVSPYKEETKEETKQVTGHREKPSGFHQVESSRPVGAGQNVNFPDAV